MKLEDCSLDDIANELHRRSDGLFVMALRIAGAMGAGVGKLGIETRAAGPLYMVEQMLEGIKRGVQNPKGNFAMEKDEAGKTPFGTSVLPKEIPLIDLTKHVPHTPKPPDWVEEVLND